MTEVTSDCENYGSHDAAVDRVIDSQVSRGGYARIPVEVLLDRRVNGTALRVYGVIVSALRYTGTVSIGMRLISKRTGIAARNVARAIKQLEAAGHVKVIPKDRGMRASYFLTSKLFHEKQGRVNLKALSSSGRIMQVAVDRNNPDGAPHWDDREDW